jgi:Tfp pilus assembly protein PilF
MDQKNYSQAELMMERALRIEPKNGYFWYTLAEIKYEEKQYARTIQLCLKSKSMAGNDVKLLFLNEQLMEKAR